MPFFWKGITVNLSRYILFIKGLKSISQLFGAKIVVALFLPNFLLFIYIIRIYDRVSYLIYKRSLSLLDNFLVSKIVVAIILPIFCCLFIFLEYLIVYLIYKRS